MDVEPGPGSAQQKQDLTSQPILAVSNGTAPSGGASENHCFMLGLP